MLRVIAVMAAVLTLAIVVMLSVPSPRSPVKVFDKVWETLDQRYALFEAKGVDWQALRDRHRPRIDDETTQEELFLVLGEMLSHLNDNHVMLRATSLGRDFGAGSLGGLIDRLGLEAAMDSLRRRPLTDADFQGEVRLAGGGMFQYGWVDEGVGYVHCGDFDDEDDGADGVDEILAEMTGARAWIVDVRSNDGGDDRAVKAVADRFADRKRLFMITRERVGPGHGDFAEPEYWHVEPAADAFTGPVVLLTSRHTVSAAENFALAMRTLPHVTVVGDTTSGCFGDMEWFRLPNRWRASFTRNLFVDYTGRCWEGIGVPPDVVVASETGGDPALATALRLLQGDGPPLQDESASAAAVRHDLIDVLEDGLRSGGFSATRREFDRVRQEFGPAMCYVDRDEINALGYRMLWDDRYDDAVGVFELYVELMPRDANAHDSLGEAYMERGDTELAIASYERSLELDPDNGNARRKLRKLR